MLQRLLAHPLTSDLDIDSPEATELRKRIVREKTFLRKIYEEWYQRLLAAADQRPVDGPLLELGSGGGFLAERRKDVIASDVFYIKDIGVILDAQAMPFADGSLKGVLMVNVLHHIPQPRRFLTETARCVKAGGLIAMIEPWLTGWSRWVYRNLHHEPLDAQAVNWEIEASGPLSGANSAMPWIIFQRDLEQFRTEFPQWQLTERVPFMPLRYLLAGGISLRALMPGITFRFWRAVEALLRPLRNQLGMFARSSSFAKTRISKA